MFNLCLRIVISQIMATRSGGEINFIALDEIFGSQDAQRRENILRIFIGYFPWCGFYVLNLSSPFNQDLHQVNPLLPHITRVLKIPMRIVKSLKQPLGQAPRNREIDSVIKYRCKTLSNSIFYIDVTFPPSRRDWSNRWGIHHEMSKLWSNQ